MNNCQSTTGSLVVRGGVDALAHLHNNGLQQGDVKAMLGASGGPKWFVLSGLDRALLGETFQGRTEPLHLLGSSAGCFRFACYGMADPVAAINRFQESYISDAYDQKPSPREVSDHVVVILKQLLGDNGAEEVLNNPVFRLNFIAVQGHGPVASDNSALQLAGVFLAALGNAVHQRLLGQFFTRVVFEHPEGGFPLKALNDLPSRRVTMDAENLFPGVLASGSIPVALEGVKDIPGAGKGLYLDGGVTDYHFDLPIDIDEGLVLYPHFREQPIPGWFDKSLSWRRPDPENYRRTLIVAPSPEFISRLPYGKIPDRTDFTRMDTDTRQAYWRTVVSESDRMGDEWLELVEKQRLVEVAKPLIGAT